MDNDDLTPVTGLTFGKLCFPGGEAGPSWKCVRKRELANEAGR